MSNYGDYYVAGIPFNGENALRHFGILGMKWGVRRYQNRDGTLTEEGRKHYEVHGKADNKVAAYTDTATGSKKIGRFNTTDDRSAFTKAIMREYEDKGVQKNISAIFWNGSEASKMLEEKAYDHMKITDDLNSANRYFSDQLRLKRGKEWTGDGTEEHWELEKQFPVYKQLSEKYDISEKQIIEAIKDAVSKGIFDDAFNNPKDLVYRYDTPEYKTSEVIDGRSAVVGYWIADNFNTFIDFEMFREIKQLNNGKLGSTIRSWGN